MELLFGEFFKQLIAAILALFMPFSALSPAISSAAKSQITITRPPVVAQSQADDNQDELEAIAEWDISDTEDDAVTMTYYDTEDQSVIDTITSSITALFAPMTAYAAENDEDAETANEVQTYENGTVVISGTGATEPYLFTRWLNADEFLYRYEYWCYANRIPEKEFYIEKSGIDENGCFKTDMVSPVDIWDECETSDDVLAKYYPVNLVSMIEDTPDFWETCATFNPKHIVIQGDVSTISFAAFVFCTNIESISLEGNVATIESCAFAYTDITEIRFPATMETLGESVFTGCTKLNAVYLPQNVARIGNYTFNDMPANSTIYCQTEEVMAVLHNLAEPSGQSADFIDSICNNNYSLGTAVEYAPEMF